MNRVQSTTYKCSECDDMWTMYGEPISEPFCPFCGYNSQEQTRVEVEPLQIDEGSTDVVVKKESIAISEDRMTKQRCSDGWWNPITKECMGTGQGFNPDNT